MGLVVRLVVTVLLVLAVMLVIRAGVRRLWPVREQHPSRRRRALAWLDAAIAKLRRIAFGGLACILVVAVARLASVHSWNSEGVGTSERAEAR